MTDLAMHMMDIVQNSIRAEARTIGIDIEKRSGDCTLTLRVTDDGKGMSRKTVEKLVDPFFTTRDTRRVGLGIPFLKMTCEQAGGGLQIISKEGEGTTIEAMYRTDNIDCLPMGDVPGYLSLLLKANPEIVFRFSYRVDEAEFVLDTEELRELGIEWEAAGMLAAVKEYIRENMNVIDHTVNG
jgi:signal transduction histidine kinase